MAEPEEAERYEQALIGVYRESLRSSGRTYDQLAETTGISRAKLVRLFSATPGSAVLEPADHFRISRALGVDLVEAVRQAEQRVLDEGAGSDAG